MAATTYTDGEQRPPGVNPISPEGSQLPGVPDVANATSSDDVDPSFWERALSDAERAERDWRTRGREVSSVRGDMPISGRPAKPAAPPPNTARSSPPISTSCMPTPVMLPAAYSKSPDPVVRSRFV